MAKINFCDFCDGCFQLARKSLLLLPFLRYLSWVFSASKKNPCYFCDFRNICDGCFQLARKILVTFAIFAIFDMGVFSQQEKSLILLRFLRYLSQVFSASKKNPCFAIFAIFADITTARITAVFPPTEKCIQRLTEVAFWAIQGIFKGSKTGKSAHRPDFKKSVYTGYFVKNVRDPYKICHIIIFDLGNSRSILLLYLLFTPNLQKTPQLIFFVSLIIHRILPVYCSRCIAVYV